MKAVVYRGLKDIRVESVADAALEVDSDVVVRVERSAICGSDLHVWHAPSWTDGAVDFTIGHEFIGVIEDAGSAVQRFKKGDRVLVSCTIGCGQCANCRRGVYSSCLETTRNLTQSNVFGFGSFAGAQAEAVRVPFADVNCFALPPSIDKNACLLLTDILPTAYMGTEMARVTPGDTVVIFGSGPVGVCAQQCAQVRGAARVIVVDLDDARLERAAASGCITINPQRQDVLATVMDLTQGVGADATIEAVGIPAVVNQGAELTRAGGQVAVIGAIMEPYEINWPQFFTKNLSLHTGVVSPQVYIPRLLPLIEQGRLNPSELISHSFDLDKAEQAYELFASRKDGVLKVVLTP